MEKNGVKKIAILYSEAKREYFPTEEQYLTEAEVFERAKSLVPYFEKIGYQVEVLPGNNQLPELLAKQGSYDFVLNLVDSVAGKEHLSAAIPAALELLNIPYIGTGMLGLAINSNKFLTKKLLEQAGVPLPRYQLFTNSNEPIDTHLKFPLISKLNEVHGSVEIDQSAVSENEAHLRARLKKLFNTYKQPVLVEEFIVGRELTTYVLEGAIRKVYIGEKLFPDTGEKYKMATFDTVWHGVNEYTYGRVENNGALETYVRQAFEALKMDDYAKFDVRLDESGRYYFIDCNANPAFGVECAVGNVLNLYGIGFDEIIRRLIINVHKDELQNSNGEAI